VSGEWSIVNGEWSMANRPPTVLHTNFFAAFFNTGLLFFLLPFYLYAFLPWFFSFSLLPRCLAASLSLWLDTFTSCRLAALTPCCFLPRCLYASTPLRIDALLPCCLFASLSLRLSSALRNYFFPIV
jgi:hypothetical protein